MWLLIVSRSSDYWLGISRTGTLIALVDVEVCLGIPSCVTRWVPRGSRGLILGSHGRGRPILGSTGRGRPLLYPASVFLKPMQTDNSTASVIINETVKQCRSKSIDMRFYWVRDRCKQKHFLIYWAPVKYNMGDYHTNTKFHSPPYQGGAPFLGALEGGAPFCIPPVFS